jgi:hypothetical protein
VAGEFATRSFIRFGWLREGVFSSLEAGLLKVRISPDGRSHLESIFWDQSRKEIETQLSQQLGSRVTLKVEIDDSMAAPPPPPVEEPPFDVIEEPPKEAAAPPAPPADPMEEFKNDPLIKKALEIFKSELQTVNS